MLVRKTSANASRLPRTPTPDLDAGLDSRPNTSSSSSVNSSTRCSLMATTTAAHRMTRSRRRCAMPLKSPQLSLSLWLQLGGLRSMGATLEAARFPPAKRPESVLPRVNDLGIEGFLEELSAAVKLTRDDTARTFEAVMLRRSDRPLRCAWTVVAAFTSFWRTLRSEPPRTMAWTIVAAASSVRAAPIAKSGCAMARTRVVTISS